jgi:hypothetical protein
MRNLVLLSFIALSLQLSSQVNVSTIAETPLQSASHPLPDGTVQRSASTKEYNFSTFSTPLKYDTRAASATVPLIYQANPDYGTMPYGSAAPNAYEEIQKRSAAERFFRDQSDPSVIYIQRASAPINYYKNSRWLSIDPRLKMIDADHYAALQQPVPAQLDLLKKRTTLGEGSASFGFNNLSMVVYDLSGAATTYTADWSDRSIGDDGMRVTNVFPGVDMVLRFMEGSVKSSFILISKKTGCSKIVFTDALDLPAGMRIAYGDGAMESEGWNGNLSINDGKGQSQYLYGNISVIPAGSETLLHGNYSLSGNQVEMKIPASVLNDAAAVYPLEIDPTVTYGPFNSLTNQIGADFFSFCSDALVVSVPGGATPTDAQIDWSISNPSNCGCVGTSRCNLSADQVYVTSSCGGATPAGAPGTVWTCGCSIAAPVNWTSTIPFGSSGTSSLATCITPSCSAQNITFTIFLNQFRCVLCSSCIYALNTCARLNNWSVTLQAKSLETLGNTSTGNGTSTVTGTCCGNSTLTASTLYGVPPYTYSWSPGGATTSSIIVSSCANGSTTYTCTVTDACGVAKTATITQTVSDCILPIELLDFDAVYNGSSVDLKWSTATEHNNVSFNIERSQDGQHFSTIATIPSAANGGNSTSLLRYSSNDRAVSEGVYYYRLQQTDLDGSSDYSQIIPVTILKDDALFHLVPNPASNSTDLSYYVYNDAPSLVRMYDVTGKLVFSRLLQNNRGAHSYSIDLDGYLPGLYFINLTTSTNSYSEKLVKKP